METNSRKARLDWIDVAKGIGILLVVYGHAMGPDNKYVYLFHMPLFMILSGFVYNPDQPFGRYIWKKFSSIYIPFVGWNLIVIFIRTAYAMDLGVWEKVADGRLNIILTTLLCINKEDRFMGATWYLGALFLISVAYKLIDMAIPKFRHRQIIHLILFGALAILAFRYTLPYTQSRTVILMFFYAFGAFLKVHADSLQKFKGFTLAFLLMAAFYCFAQFTYASMGTNEYGNIPLFVVCAFLGSFSMITFSRWLCERKFIGYELLRWPLRVMGKNTMDILIWHFVAFRFVVAYQLFLDDIPLSELFNYDGRYNTEGMWWLAYLAAGIVISLLWGWLLRHGPLGKFLRKIHLVR